MSKQGCAERVFDNLSLHRSPCGRDGTIERKSKWWCWQHDPVATKERKNKKDAIWSEKNRQTREHYRRRSAETLAVGFLTTDQLQAGLVKATFSSHDTLADMLRAVQGLDDAAGNDSGELDQLYCDLLPKIKAALAGIPLESALKEAHDE